MANELTGDFDLVAEFSVPAANRVLASMHRGERFPHSLSIRVDDNPPPDRHFDWPTVAVSVDTVGEPTLDPSLIGTVVISPGVSSGPLRGGLDLVVNPDLVGVATDPVVPSLLRGRAQLQLSPPTIEVPDGSGTTITVRQHVMSRYFPDAQTSPLAEFVRGEIRITASVSLGPSKTAAVRTAKIDVTGVTFVVESSSQPLGAADIAAVNLVIRNALKTSFLPSAAELPADVATQFKTLLGAQGAIAVLLNMGQTAGTPGTFQNVFLKPGDDLAFAAGREFILAMFPTVRDHRVRHFGSYDVSDTTQTLDLQGGKFVITVQGHVHRTSWPRIDFDFKVTQALTLKLIASTLGGPVNTAELVSQGDPSLELSGLPWGLGWIFDLFKGSALGPIKEERDKILQDQQPAVRDRFSVDKYTGKFFDSLLKPPEQNPGLPPPQEMKPVLAYTGFEIKASGIVLHGSLAVPSWPPARVRFEQILTSNGGGPGGVADGLEPPEYEYTALNSWIPGGMIQRYEWSAQGQAQPFHTDVDKFVLLPAPPSAVASLGSTTSRSRMFDPAVLGFGYSPICLTIRGARLSSSGPVVVQPVSASVCGYTSVSVLEGLQVPLDGTILRVALAQRGPRGLVEVAGHASARPERASGGTLNRLVHFADENTAGSVEFLRQALRESRRDDAATVVVAVLTPDQLAKARYTEGVIYAEDPDGAWARAFGVKATRRPVTVIVGPKGDQAWQHEGELDTTTLAAALREKLVSGGSVRLRMLRSNLMIGRPAPNFFFESAPGRGLTLRTLVGHPAVLVFWNSLSKPSIETVRDLQETAGEVGAPMPVVLAINDGEAPDVARRIAAENRLSTTLVPDPKRKMALAYGVSLWPTVVFIDPSGLVREIRYGRFAGQSEPEHGSKGPTHHD